jgi:hypothetical protein
VLGFNIHDQPPGKQANNALSASPDSIWTVKKTINYHEWVVEDNQGKEFFLSVENGFVPCFKVGTVIHLTRK